MQLSLSKEDRHSAAFKPTFHGTDTDILATILARMSVSVPWNAAFTLSSSLIHAVENVISYIPTTFVVVPYTRFKMLRSIHIPLNWIGSSVQFRSVNF